MPRFSIIVPVLDRKDALRRALRSVASQTFADFECIVVDDASVQAIRPVVAEFDERFSYLRRETNGGCTAAKFTGLESADGEFALTLDSDNELFPWTLQRATYYFEQYPDAGCACWIVRLSGRSARARARRDQDGGSEGLCPVCNSRISR